MLQCTLWQELHPRPLHQFLITDRPTHRLPLAVLLPVRPSTLIRSVIHQLVQIGWHLDPVGANARTTVREHRPRDHIHISFGPSRIAPGVLLDLVPGTPVVLDVLRNHVGQAEALSHSRWGGHVPCRRHMPPAVPRVSAWPTWFRR